MPRPSTTPHRKRRRLVIGIGRLGRPVARASGMSAVPGRRHDLDQPASSYIGARVRHRELRHYLPIYSHAAPVCWNPVIKAEPQWASAGMAGLLGLDCGFKRLR